MKRILVVEDEPPILRDICAQIQVNVGDEVIIDRATDGGAAMEFIKSGFVPDLIITDIRMPVVDGIALSEWLHAEHPSLPVVMISGYKDFEYARSALRLGVSDYLLKPVVPAEISTLLRKMERFIAARREEDFAHAIESVWLGNPPSPDAEEGYEVGLIIVAVGSFCGDRDDDPITDIVVEKIDLSGQLDKIFGQRCRWMGTGPSSCEKIITVDLGGKPSDWFGSVVAQFHESTTAPGVCINMAAYEVPLKLSMLRPGYENLKRKLLSCMVIGHPQLLMEPEFLPENQKRDCHEDLIAEAETFLRQHFTEAINGELLSRKIGIVPSYLSKLFKKRTGYTPPEFLIQLRVERARELLDCSDVMMIKDIAHAVGYQDPNHFSRVFHKTCGYWPSEYRRRPKAEEPIP